jgi:hypothetical protein
MMAISKYSSLESNKNNMKSKTLLFLLLMGSFFAKAQQTTSEKKATSAELSTISLKEKLSSKVLHAYQENSKTKIEDLFGYFQMLTDASLNDDFKKEVTENINQLFKTKNTLVLDFTSDSFNKIPLDIFIQKLLISEPILFTVSGETRYDTVAYQSWKTGYTITRIKSGIKQQINVVQTVYWYEDVKTFGTTIKRVDTTKLGEMQ